MGTIVSTSISGSSKKAMGRSARKVAKACSRTAHGFSQKSRFDSSMSSTPNVCSVVTSCPSSVVVVLAVAGGLILAPTSVPTPISRTCDSGLPPSDAPCAAPADSARPARTTAAQLLGVGGVGLGCTGPSP